MTTWSMSSPSPEGIVPFVEPWSAPSVQWSKAGHDTGPCLSRRHIRAKPITGRPVRRNSTCCTTR